MSRRHRVLLVVGLLAVAAAGALLIPERGQRSEDPELVERETKPPTPPSPPRLTGQPTLRGDAAPQPAGDPAPVEPGVASADPFDPADGSWTVEGVVMDAATGGPVPYVVVIGLGRRWVPEEQKLVRHEARAESAHDGRFSLGAQRYVFDFALKSESWSVFDWHLEGKPKVRRFDESQGRTVQVVLHAQRSFFLRGRVVDERGRAPLKGVAVKYAVIKRGHDGNTSIGNTAAWTAGAS